MRWLWGGLYGESSLPWHHHHSLAPDLSPFPGAPVPGEAYDWLGATANMDSWACSLRHALGNSSAVVREGWEREDWCLCLGLDTLPNLCDTTISWLSSYIACINAVCVKVILFDYTQVKMKLLGYLITHENAAMDTDLKWYLCSIIWKIRNCALRICRYMIRDVDVVTENSIAVKMSICSENHLWGVAG